LTVALSDRRRVFRAVLAVVLLSAVGLSACGRKGALEPPPSAQATQPNDSNASPNPKDQKPNRPFALDFLI
jgi:predicted small lipoprotein YifL